MAVGAFSKLAGTTIEITEAKYEKLIAEREQLRILKNFTKAESVINKKEIIKLIEIMEVDNG